MKHWCWTLVVGALTGVLTYALAMSTSYKQQMREDKKQVYGELTQHWLDVRDIAFKIVTVSKNQNRDYNLLFEQLGTKIRQTKLLEAQLLLVMEDKDLFFEIVQFNYIARQQLLLPAGTVGAPHPFHLIDYEPLPGLLDQGGILVEKLKWDLKQSSYLTIKDIGCSLIALFSASYCVDKKSWSEVIDEIPEETTEQDLAKR